MSCRLKVQYEALGVTVLHSMQADKTFELCRP